MHKLPNDSKAFNNIRELILKADEICKESTPEGLDESKDLSTLTPIDNLHNIQEYQLNLELQNEELLLIQTELEDSQLRFKELYKDLYDQAPVGYCTINAENVILKHNLYTTHLLSRQGQHLLGQKLTDFIHPDDQDIYYLHCKKLQELNISSHCEVRMLKASGEAIWVSINQMLTKTNTKQAIFYLAISDISELKALQEAAEAANRAKSSFLSNMSHEIRTPMNAILGFTYLLRQEQKDPKSIDKLDKINHSAQHLLDVINDILSLSKIEADAIELEQIPFKLSDTLNKVKILLTDQLEKKALEFIVDIDSQHKDLPLIGDPLRLTQILLNYLTNAIKFTAQGQVTLRVKIENEQVDNLLLKFEIQDTGIGLTDTQIAKLFQAFSQADTSITRQYGGTGLGLIINRRLALLMGGDTGVISSPGLGSTFWFTACLKYSKPFEQEIIVNSAEAPIRRGARILLVEDDEFNQELACILLDDKGLSIDIANNGEEAIAMVKAKAYDLILMDVQMPVMGGLEATRCIRQLGCGQFIPIIAMTATAFEDDQKHCFAAGMDSFLGKPIEPKVLYSELARWLPE